MAVAGAELAGADHFHLYALRAAARQPAWAGCGAAATQSIPPLHLTTAYPLNYSFSHMATPHAPTYSLTQVPGWNQDPILTGPHPRSRMPSLSCTPHYIPHHISALTLPLHLHPSPMATSAPCEIHLQPCEAVSNLSAALARPPPPPSRVEGGEPAPSWCELLLGPLLGLGALNTSLATAPAHERLAPCSSGASWRARKGEVLLLGMSPVTMSDWSLLVGRPYQRFPRGKYRGR